MLFGDDKKQVDFIEELRIIRGIVDELKETTPHFELRLILTGLKIVGMSHIEKMLKHIKIGSECKDKKLAELIAGFDMVNEEDFTPEIGTFAETILDYQDNVKIADLPPGEKMPTFFHAGETQQRDIKNLEDAIMLGTKRIGHGFQL